MIDLSQGLPDILEELLSAFQCKLHLESSAPFNAVHFEVLYGEVQSDISVAHCFPTFKDSFQPGNIQYSRPIAMNN